MSTRLSEQSLQRAPRGWGRSSWLTTRPAGVREGPPGGPGGSQPRSGWMLIDMGVEKQQLERELE